MLGLMLNRGGLGNSRKISTDAIGSGWRAGRVQFALLAGLVSLVALAYTTSLKAEILDPADDMPPPMPQIVGFTVSWVAADDLITFKFTGTIVGGENLNDPTVKLSGYPFDALVMPDSTGAFSYEASIDADEAFGRTVGAVIMDNGAIVSDQVFTST